MPPPFSHCKNKAQFSVSEGAGIDAHGPVIGVQNKPALGKGKIRLPHHKGGINDSQQLATAYLWQG